MNKSNLNDIDDDSVSSFDLALVADQKMPSNDTTDKSNAKEYIADGAEIYVGHMFESIECAKQTITAFAGCAVHQSSTRNMKYVEYSCFQSGSYTKKTSDCVSDENKRKSKSIKCGCKFCVRLKLTKCGTYEVCTIVNTCNHELYTTEELQQLPQNQFIPESVQQKMLELHKLGVLSPSQIMTLTESEFSETAVTWTKRDVQNLLQAHTYRSHEAFEFIELLQQQKQRKKWEVEIQLNSETLRLEHIFWMSDKGKDCYRKFSDVTKRDATYKTNRFGLPLLLFCGVDNNGITFVIAGCLLSDEQFESYECALLNFRKLGYPAPSVIFTDGDAEFGRAIHRVWPEAIHLLCRFHIAQNITKNLAGILREDLSDFLSDF
jgi:hypothetical protein